MKIFTQFAIWDKTIEKNIWKVILILSCVSVYTLPFCKVRCQQNLHHEHSVSLQNIQADPIYSDHSKNDLNVLGVQNNLLQSPKDFSLLQQSVFTAKSVTTVDLNGALPGTDNSVIARVGFIFPTVTIDNIISVTTSGVTNVRLTFSSNASGVPAGVPDGQDNLFFYEPDGITQIGSLPINTAGPGPITALDRVYGSNTFRFTIISSGVFEITDLGGAPILTTNLQSYLYNIRYAHTGTAGGGTEGPRYMIVDVTDPDDTLSATSVINAQYFPTAVDDTDNLLANDATPSSGNLLANDTDLSASDTLTIFEVNGVSGAVGSSFSSIYGSITVLPNGDYDYLVDTDNIAVLGLRSGAILIDIISYGVEDLNGNIDYGFITITIDGVDELPVATDNQNSVTVVTNPTATGSIIFDDDGFGVDSGDRPLAQFIWEDQFSAPGGVFVGFSAPIDGESRVEPTTGVSLNFTSADPDGIGIADQNQVIAQTGTNGGHFGYLLFAIDATVNPSQSTALTIDFDEPVVNLSFTLSDIDWSQGDSWQDQMTVTGSLAGSDVSYIPQISGSVVQVGSDTFYGTGSVPPQDAHGNVNIYFDTPVDQVVLSYNYGPDATAADNGGQIAGVSDLNWQGTGAPRISELDGNPANIGVQMATTYGFITVNSDGSYIYTLDPLNPAVISLAAGSILIDTIPYTLIDTIDNTGDTDTANLIITINGSAVDSDDDGEVDVVDLDDDNDGIPDHIECGDPNISVAGAIDISRATGVNGDASFDSSNLDTIELTADADNNVGSAISTLQIDMTEDFTLSYSANFGTNNDTNLGDGDAASAEVGGGDGITFILHNDPAATSTIGEGGSGIGASTIVNGIAIEFDTFDNTFFGGDEGASLPDFLPPFGGVFSRKVDHTAIWDTDAGTNPISGSPGNPFNHIGDIPQASIGTGGEIEDGIFHDITINWDATAQVLTWSFDGVTVGTFTDDIINNRLAGSDAAFFGFSASTDILRNRHQVTLTSFLGTLIFCDTDSDSIDDYLDLDSDNDGCPDFVEGDNTFTESVNGQTALGTLGDGNGGTVTTNLGNTVGNTATTNGIPAIASTGQGVGISQNGSSENCTDSDGDGVEDITDLDDDNDGILDSDEKGSGAIDFTAVTTVADGSGSSVLTLAPVLLPDDIEFLTATAAAGTTIFGPLNSTALGGSAPGVDLLRSSISGAAPLDQILSFPVPVEALEFTMYDLDTDEFVSFEATLNGNPVAITVIPGSLISETSGTYTGTSFSNNFNTGTDQQVKVLINGAIDRFTYIISETAPTDPSFGVTVDNVTVCTDTDNDTIPDSLDLDSDNDSCPDYIEGSGSFTETADGQVAQGTLSDGNGNIVISNLGNTVGATPGVDQGVPTTAGTGQGVGASKDAANAIACIPDDMDGVNASIEDNGPNGGDANDDGMLDSIQPDVASIPTLDGSYVAIEITSTTPVNGDCNQITGMTLVTEAGLAEDGSYDYPLGLVDFSLQCNTIGESARIKYYWWGLSTLTELDAYRKFGPSTPGGTDFQYRDGSIVSIVQQIENINGFDVLTITYDLTDGVLGDDTLPNAQIDDPTGPAVSVDYDNDGVDNVMDLDDDNDGILDDIECPGFFITADNFPSVIIIKEDFEAIADIPNTQTQANPKNNFQSDFNFSSTPNIITNRSPDFVQDMETSPWFRSADGFSFGVLQAIDNTPNSVDNDGIGLVYTAAELKLIGVLNGDEIVVEFLYSQGFNYDVGLVGGRSSDTDSEILIWFGNGTFNFASPPVVVNDSVIPGAWTPSGTVNNDAGDPADVMANNTWMKYSNSFVYTGGDIYVALVSQTGAIDSGSENIYLDEFILASKNIRTIDTDGDGLVDCLDIDSDNDGIPDNVEAQPTVGYIAPGTNGVVGPADVDPANGIPSVYSSTGLDITLASVNNDSDGSPDYLDIDSDGDGILDVIESGESQSSNTNDIDADGLLDDYDDVNTVSGAPFDVNDNLDGGSIDTPNTDVGDATQTDTDVDYRDPVEPIDTDGDGINDAVDLDDDNDGILDRDESDCDPAGNAPSLLAGWDPNPAGIGNGNNGNTGTPKLNRYEPNFVDNTLVEATVGTAMIGPGLVDESLDPSNNVGSHGYYYVSGADSPDAATAMTNGDYVEYSFTTLSTETVLGRFINIQDVTTFLAGTFETTRGVNLSANPVQFPIYADFSYQLEISADNFSSSAILVPGVQTVRTSDGSAFPGGNALNDPSHEEFQVIPNFPLSPNTTYKVRLLLFASEDTSGNSFVTFDNFRLSASNCNISDFDGDGIPNTIDLDSDNDGVYDVVESGNPLATDSDNDGRIDTGGVVSVGANGIPDEVDADDDSINTTATTPVNSFGTDGADYLDIDADDDGIQDNIESQPTVGYISPTGTDTDGDGIDDAYDPVDDTDITAPVAGSGTAIVPINTDSATGDIIPDYLDLDSDADGESDNLEGYDTDGDGVIDIAASNADSDGDGLDDAYDQINLSTTPILNPTDNGEVSGDFPDIDMPGGEADWREINDSDNDGVPDNADLDDDNDGILDDNEDGINTFDGDEDGDGILNYLDVVDDGNAGDGSVTDYTDTNGDNIADVYDADLDGVPNHLDIDSDNDGIPDNVEAQPTIGYISPGTNGVVTPADVDSVTGIPTVYPVTGLDTTLASVNNDTDGIPDYLDSNSDDNGTIDTIEAGLTIPTNMNDTDGDGLLDAFDIDNTTADVNNDLDNGSSDTPNTDTGISGQTDTDVDYRDPIEPIDSDNDTIPDSVDLDDDNDGILDSTECPFQSVNFTPLSGGVGTATNFINAAGNGNGDLLPTNITVGSVTYNGTNGSSQVTDVNGGDVIRYRFIGAETGASFFNDITFDTPQYPTFGTPFDNGSPVGSSINQSDFFELRPIGASPTFQWIIIESNPAADARVVGDALVIGAAPGGGAGGSTPFAEFRITTNEPISGINILYNNLIDLTGTGGFNTGLFSLSLCPDTDKDGVPNIFDLDSDNDGIYDLVEGGDPNASDTDNNGIIDTAGVVNVGANGIPNEVDSDDDALNATATIPINSFGTDAPDYLDIDADDDGIVDNIEAQTTLGYQAPSGIDTDGDGVDDQYDPDNGGTSIIPTNTDATFTNSDAIPDYLDTDSDGDAESDTIEAYDTDQDGVADTVPANTDSDGDGLDDNFDDITLTTGSITTNPTNGGQTATNPFPDTDMPGAEPNWREINDTDMDGVPDTADLDDDNDGILDEEEDGINTFDGDEDGDGVLNYIDVIDDGNAGDGSTTNYADSNGDGIADVYDTDLDGVPNHLDIDSDNDGIPDNVEAQPTIGYISPGTNGVVGPGDVGTTGIPTVYDQVTGIVTIENSDTDTIPDYLDLDSDNDGLTDTVEGGLSLATNANDTDGDGLLDAYDADNSIPDVNNDLDGGSIDTPNTDVGDATQTDTDVDYRDPVEPIDTDGDGINDAVDLDDDNDGILDRDESDCDPAGNAPSLLAGWDPNPAGIGNGNNGNTGTPKLNRYEPNFVDNTLVEATVGTAMIGPGLVDESLDPSNNVGSHGYYYVSGADSPDAATAMTNGDYVEYSFTTLSTETVLGRFINIQDVTTFLAGTFETTRGVNLSANPVQFPIYADFSYQLEISADNFSSSAILVPGVQTVRTSDGSAFPGGNALNDPSHEEFQVIPNFPLSPNTTYKVRLLLFASEDTSGNSFVTFDNFRLSASNCNISDFDGDGIPNTIDLDSDNDGVYDVVESGNPLATDSDNDGRIDTGGVVSVGANGIPDEVDADDDSINTTATTPVNSFGTDGADYLDIDADDDGIQDNIESQPTVGYISPTGTDTDGDGIDDAYDPVDDTDITAPVAGSGTAIVPINTDSATGDIIPDYLDLDSDADGESDNLEGYDTDGDGVIDIAASNADSDGDGLDDAYDQINLSTTPILNPTDNGEVSGDFPDTDVVGGEPNWRDLLDTDSDIIPDTVDLDDDNDGILDTVENSLGIDPSADADGDGIPNYQDFNDNGSGTTPVCTDINLDGICDTLDSVFDTDGDGVPNHFDLDSDNDGIYDVIEAGGIDTNDDGLHDDDDNNEDNTATSGIPSEANGGTGIIAPTDTGSDGSLDYLTLDSDGDGCSDANEAYNDATADGGDSGVFGVDPADPTTIIDPDGTVIAASYTDPVDGDTDLTDDYQQIGGPDGDGDGTPDACDLIFEDYDGDGIGDAVDLDDDNDGILDVEEYNCPTGGSTLGWDTATDPWTGNPASSIIPTTATITRDGTLVTASNALSDAGIASFTALSMTFNGTLGVQLQANIDEISNGSTIRYEITFDQPVIGLNFSVVDIDERTGVDEFTDQVTIMASNGGTPINLINGTNFTAGPAVDVLGGGVFQGNTQVTSGTDADVNLNFTKAVDAIIIEFTNVGSTISTMDTAILISELAWNCTFEDFDNDNIPNHLDLDSDNDGITDLTESGQLDNGAIDTNNDGIIDGTPGDFGANGLADTVESDDTIGATTANPVNTDTNGEANYLDIDSDDDGIVDTIEGQTTTGYLPPANNDTDMDGIDDQYDTDCSIVNCGISGTPIIPANTDGLADGADYIDLDSDEDGEDDTIEAYDSNDDGVVDGTDTIGTTPDLTALGTDIDGDGLDDEFDADTASPDTTNGGQTATNPFPDTDSPGGEPDWRDTINNDLEITKVDSYVDTNSNGIIDAGDTINYVFTVTNNGTATITGISLTESDPNVILSGGPIPSLTAGASDNTTFTATYTILSSDITTGNYSNTATVNGGDPNGNLITSLSDDPDDLSDATDDDNDGSPDDPTVTDLSQPLLDITKTDSYVDTNANGIIDAGDTI
ncbi:VCBS domain-containing protein, partial [Aquimarina sp. RZ0]|uniref:lectin-like domain-containing protein n=1 Tax=Aquimarina sp. RZ0 TaxID=2607730 RepID=UPI00165FD403